MARLGFIEWYPADELADADAATPFSDPEVRARMAALIARAAQAAHRNQDFSSALPAAPAQPEQSSAPDDAP